jgi:glutamine synthetase
MPLICDYIFIDGLGEIRTKNRVLYNFTLANALDGHVHIPDFATDGSSTYQADETGNTEIILRPQYYCRNPLRNNSVIVVCDTYDAETNKPLPSNTRAEAAAFFQQESVKNEKIWYGWEQEYYFEPFDRRELPAIGTHHYCGVSNLFEEQQIVDEHLQAMLNASIDAHGTNAEVSYGQWEFQLMPLGGIEGADQLLLARFLLRKIASKYGYEVVFDPKPYRYCQGSGCHLNISTKKTRGDNGFDEIVKVMPKFEQMHDEHIAVYGEGNAARLTGKCETASIDHFSWGVGTRTTSIRVPTKCKADGSGYFEDRRPAANVDPYLAAFRVAQTLTMDL